jgi:transposase
VRGLGCLIRIILTAGQRGDAPQAAALLSKDQPGAILADAAYDADHLRAAIAQAGATAAIPNHPSRATKRPFDRQLYKERHPIECCFSRLKQLRRVVTRCEKTARNYLAIVTLAATILCLR